MPTLPRVGPEVPTRDLAGWLTARAWDAIAARWPALDPSQRITVVYAISGVPVPPGFSSSGSTPTDWLVAMVLVSQRHGLLSGANLAGRQWAAAWTDPQSLMPEGLADTTAQTWVAYADRCETSRHTLRRAALQSSAAPAMPFDLVWDLARPLTRDTVGAVAGHPNATVEALVEAAEFRPLQPDALARLATSRQFPAERVPELYRDAEQQDAAPLVGSTISPSRLLQLLEQPLPRWLLRELVTSQRVSRQLAAKMTASTAALTALFSGLDVTRDTNLRDAALASRRVEARRALAAAVTDPAVLATLADDPDPDVRATAARRVLDALSPTDLTDDLDEELSA
jgi:hypothetical protein